MAALAAVAHRRPDRRRGASRLRRDHPQAEVLGLQASAEELVASKIFVAKRERFDGADIAHIIYGTYPRFDWELRRAAQAAEVTADGAARSSPTSRARRVVLSEDDRAR